MSMILIGLAFILIALVMAFSGLRFFLSAVETRGKIIRMESTRNSNNIDVSAPVVRYRDRTGVSHTHFSSYYRLKNNHLNVGDEITILYSPTRPDYAFAGTVIDFFSFEKYVLLLGVVLLLGGLYEHYSSVIQAFLHSD